MKAFTNLAQSKKLAEILPLESADMWWNFYSVTTDNTTPLIIHLDTPWVGNFNWDNKPDNVPCWSLAALLQVLPLGIYDEFDNCDYELEIDMIDKMPRYIRLGDIYHSKFPYDFEKDTLLDNVVESIIWLNDNNYFEL